VALFNLSQNVFSSSCQVFVTLTTNDVLLVYVSSICFGDLIICCVAYIVISGWNTIFCLPWCLSKDLAGWLPVSKIMKKYSTDFQGILWMDRELVKKPLDLGTDPVSFAELKT
jgi:hypothetical protein